MMSEYIYDSKAEYLSGGEAYRRGQAIRDCPRYEGFLDEDWLNGWVDESQKHRKEISSAMLYWGKIIDRIMREWHNEGEMTKYDFTKNEIEKTPGWQ